MTTRKLRLYLDTSVISMIDTPPESERGNITKEFFRMVADTPDEFELFISPATQEELDEAPDAKQIQFATFLRSTAHVMLPENDDAENLAWIYVVENVLRANHIDDLRHVAYAVMARCDYIISWNMKHLVRPRTITRVNEVNFVNNYPRIIIATPQLITGEIDHAND